MRWLGTGCCLSVGRDLEVPSKNLKGLGLHPRPQSIGREGGRSAIGM